jgi:hypothetical protein
MDSMRPVTATWASVPVYGVAGNRDHPRTESPIDLDLLCLTHVHGPETAILGSFACHPTVLGASNLSISADLSGAFCRQLSTLLGESVWVGLATGAGGDISTRHTRRGQDFRELERLGSILAESARNALEQRQTIRLADPLVQEYRVLLPTRTPAGQQEVESTQAELSRQRAELLRAGRLNEARTIETSLQGLALSSKPRPDAVRARIGVATLGDVALMAIPGELYSKLGRELRRSREHLLLLGYTNGYIGYIPTRAAYASALDYEVLASCLAPGAGEELVKVATQLLATQPEEMLR